MRISNSLSAEFCIEAVEVAIANFGTPEIFNSDQGSQFTGSAFIGMLTRHRIRISMDGRGCWRDNMIASYAFTFSSGLAFSSSRLAIFPGSTVPI